LQGLSRPSVSCQTTHFDPQTGFAYRYPAAIATCEPRCDGVGNCEGREGSTDGRHGFVLGAGARERSGRFACRITRTFFFFHLFVLCMRHGAACFTSSLPFPEEGCFRDGSFASIAWIQDDQKSLRLFFLSHEPFLRRMRSRKESAPN
jgi:hypothetical protein